MWPRVVELMIGCWLLMTPFVFRGTTGVSDYLANAYVSGGLIVIASLFSFWERTRLAHLITVGVAVWLAVHGYLSAARPGPPAAQNEITTGLILLLFAILPNESNAVPTAWRERATSKPS